uniref:Uncharacterized protein n=1 Tax=Parascaris univalens TaxID=6257 RepID=A0A915A5E2_PARUN
FSFIKKAEVRTHLMRIENIRNYANRKKENNEIAIFYSLIAFTGEHERIQFSHSA